MTAPPGSGDAPGPAPEREAAIWRPAPPRGDAAALAGVAKTPQVAALLARRGLTTEDEARRFLNPSPDDLNDPFLLAGMEAAVARLERATEQEELVVVVGDYDVDGVTGTALLVAVLAACGVRVEPVLPHRTRDGYGFQTVQVERATELGAGLIVTVDCGTTSAVAIRAAREAGLDVIVTDHHVPGADFPDDAIQINPLQAACRYPFPHLSGVGLALKLAQAFAARRARSIELAPLLRIACLGTIADVVPLTGENRVIAALGLRALEKTRAVGLRALIEEAGVRPPFQSDDVGFRLGPRINAVGRLSSPDAALELLLSRDAERAAQLAARLGHYNELRQGEEKRVVDGAREILAELVAARSSVPGILVAWSEEWHRGVVGIAAGRIAQEYHRPTLLLAVEGETATGSGRSIRDVELHAFLERWRPDLVRFGGHAFAVGLTARTDRLEALRAAWEEAADWPPEVLRRTYEYELELAPEEIDRDLMADLRRLAPFGAENPQPLVCVRGLSPTGPASHFGTDHVRMRARGAAGGGLWLVGWRFRERAAELESGSFDALGTLDWDDYRGAPMLTLVDCRPATSETG